MSRKGASGRLLASTVARATHLALRLMLSWVVFHSCTVRASGLCSVTAIFAWASTARLPRMCQGEGLTIADREGPRRLVLLVCRHPYQIRSGIIVEGVQDQGIYSGEFGFRRACLFPASERHVRPGLTVGEEAVLPKDGVQRRLAESPALRTSDVVNPRGRDPLAAAVSRPLRSIMTNAHPHLTSCRYGPSREEPST